MRNQSVLKFFMGLTMMVCFLTTPSYGSSLVVKYTNRTGPDSDLVYKHVECKHGQVNTYHPEDNIHPDESTTAIFETTRYGLYGPDCTVTFIDRNFDEISIRTALGLTIPSTPVVDIMRGFFLNAQVVSIEASADSMLSKHPGKVDLAIIKFPSN